MFLFHLCISPYTVTVATISSIAIAKSRATDILLSKHFASSLPPAEHSQKEEEEEEEEEDQEVNMDEKAAARCRDKQMS